MMLTSTGSWRSRSLARRPREESNGRMKGGHYGNGRAREATATTTTATATCTDDYVKS
jgi:hypothetical protein